MRKTRTIKKLLTALTVTVLGTAFTVSAGACTHRHTYSTDWTADEAYHWRAATCQHTGEVSDKSAHVYGDDDICDVCTYDRSSGLIKPPAPSGKRYTVSFGNVDADLYPPIQVEENGTVNVEEPTSADATFLGWFTDEACTEQFFINSTKVTKDTTLYAKWKTAGGGVQQPVTKRYAVSFNSNGGSAVDPQSVEEGKKAFLPPVPERAGYQFRGWFINDTEYSFDNPVNKDLTLVAKWDVLDAKIKAYGGYNESLYVEWADGAPSQAQVQYKAHGANVWTDVDGELIRAKSGASSVARVDIIGVSAGDYDVKITASDGSGLSLESVKVSAYDRSGYAHFNYTDGVGAYNDDGSLKDGALVIYVTESNKNNVADYAYKNTANGLVKEDISAYIKPGKPTLEGKDLGGETYGSIGYILNNRGYANNGERETYGIQKLTFTYGAVAVRILGNVVSETNFSTGAPSIHGLTFYSKSGGTNPYTGEQYKKGVTVPNGGTVGDNGEMARITNAKNLTIEGVGDDAGLEGWGLHFVSNDNLNKFNGQAGKSFEVRNLTFKNYPEDAVGMEGTQGVKVDQTTGSITTEGNASTARIISGAERCWVHNNAFLPGYCPQPAESDKGEGDGSCDFKRGQYFTCSYNYFEYCHKTNLVGSSDDSLQFNLTYHHNMWYNCGARIPLLRNANAHFYNNYVYADATDSHASLSYVHSMRANSYLFSEANFYDGCKQVSRKETESGRAKSWNNVFYSCYEVNELKVVSSREEAIDNNCKYASQNIDLSSFDTNPSLFYYNAAAKTSDCLLDDAVTARVRVLQNVGSNGFAVKNLQEKFNGTTRFNKYVPDAAVQINDNAPTVIAIPTSKGSSEISGVLFNDFTGSGKGKGQIVTFTLATEAEITIQATASGPDQYPHIVTADGAVVVSKFSGEIKCVLPAGTYVVATGQKDKEVTISSLSFASTAGSAQAKIDNLNAAIDALPSAITVESGSLIGAAKTAVSALNETELANYKTENAARWTKYQNALTAYSQAQINDVIAKINAIGTVNDNSYPAIKAARDAYAALSSAQRQNVTNYSALTQAETDWDNRAVTAINNRIAALEDVSSWTAEKGKDAITAKKAEYEAVKSAYEALASNTGVNNYGKVTNGLTKLDVLLAEIAQAEADAAKLAEFRAALASITDVENSTIAQLSPIVSKYEALGELKNQLTSEEATAYGAIKTKYDALAAEEAANTITVSFNGSNMTCDKADAINLSYSGSYKTGLSVTLNNVAYTTGLKFQSSAGEIKFKLPTAKTLTIYVQSADVSISINGTKTAKATAVTKAGYSGAFAITFNAEANVEYSLKKGDGEAHVLMLEFTKPAETATASYTLESRIDLAEAKFN